MSDADPPGIADPEALRARILRRLAGQIVVALTGTDLVTEEHVRWFALGYQEGLRHAATIVDDVLRER